MLNQPETRVKPNAFAVLGRWRSDVGFHCVRDFGHRHVGFEWLWLAPLSSQFRSTQPTLLSGFLQNVYSIFMEPTYGCKPPRWRGLKPRQLHVTRETP